MSTLLPAPTALPGTSTGAFAIDNEGEIAGFSLVDNGFIGTAWNGASLPGTLPYLPGDISAGAYGVNDSGEIVGFTASDNQDVNKHAVLWENGKTTALGTLGGTFSWALAINDQNQVVGEATNASGAYQAFLWQNGAMTALSTLPGGANPTVAGDIYSDALAINDGGQAVGFSVTTGGVTHAALWQNGTVTDLGLFPGGGSFSTADGINNLGQVVGYALTAGNVQQAALWENGTVTDLGGLIANGVSGASSINQSGVIVGQAATNAGNTIEHAVVWQNGVITDLNSLLPANSGWVLTDAFSINDGNQVVGEGTLNGAETGFELTLISGAGAPVITPAPVFAPAPVVTPAPATVVAPPPTITDIVNLAALPGFNGVTPLSINNQGAIVGTDSQLVDMVSTNSGFLWSNGVMTALNPFAGANGSETFSINDAGVAVGESFTLLYQNVLDRLPDPSGAAFWNGQLNSGAQTRAQVVLSFTESAEFMTDTTFHPATATTPASGFIFLI